MNLKLIRYFYRPDGIFGELVSPDDCIRLAYTLEHSYLIDHNYFPKVEKGIYVCKKGIHTLKNKISFETFEVMNVPYHTGILFHPGNTNIDSEGCILLGLSWNLELGSLEKSKIAFQNFMEEQKSVQEFQLEVTDDISIDF